MLATMLATMLVLLQPVVALLLGHCAISIKRNSDQLAEGLSLGVHVVIMGKHRKLNSDSVDNFVECQPCIHANGFVSYTLVIP